MRDLLFDAAFELRTALELIKDETHPRVAVKIRNALEFITGFRE